MTSMSSNLRRSATSADDRSSDERRLPSRPPRPGVVAIGARSEIRPDPRHGAPPAAPVVVPVERARRPEEEPSAEEARPHQQSGAHPPARSRQRPVIVARAESLDGAKGGGGGGRGRAGLDADRQAG